MHEKLLAHISRFVDLTHGEQQLLAASMEYRAIPKRKILLKPSQVCTSLYFVVSGSLRLYSMKSNGAEQILQFGLADWWICDYQSLENGTVSGYYIDAVDDAEVLVLDLRTRNELFDRIPMFERYFRLLMQRGYAAGIKRVSYFLTGSREEMYLQFVRLYPEFAHSVPQYMLASFLGMTPEFLSKIRGKKGSTPGGKPKIS
ncbi:MAG: Crp/Fnr family transcriptional regulator [Chitinophagaceae bacterium]|nr:MAG: Crp/Fnr family transcriptional regulator [Chitinophagaceae bacterium]